MLLTLKEKWIRTTEKNKEHPAKTDAPYMYASHLGRKIQIQSKLCKTRRKPRITLETLFSKHVYLSPGEKNEILKQQQRGTTQKS